MKKIGIGTFAKQMKVSIRTLQYYDSIGLLKPSGYSEGGRRYYTAKDSIAMYQIKALKELGFSLEQIRLQLKENRNLDDIKKLLADQKDALRIQIKALQEAYNSIQVMEEKLKEAEDLDYEEYMEILEKMYINPVGYWVVTCMDQTLNEHIKQRFGDEPDIGMKIYDTWHELSKKVMNCIDRNVLPESLEGQEVAKQWWNMVLEFTGGDLQLITHLEKFNLDKDNWDATLASRQEMVDSFLQPALELYLKELYKEENLL